MKRALLLAITAIATLSATTAQADFMQTLTCQPSGMNRCQPGETPLPVRWYQQEVEYNINDRGSALMHPDAAFITDELRDSVFEAFDEWNNQECSEFEMIYAGRTTTSTTGYNLDVPHDDNLNIVVWRDDAWPHPGYHAVALTTVTYRPSNGMILSADIEFNTADYVYTDTEGSAGAIIDFRNTLTHEVGHFLGLDHSPNPAATMYATAPPGEISKRTLHPADIEGLCHIYPLGQSFEPEDNLEDYTPLQTGPSPRRRWCSTSPHHDGPALPAFLLVLGALALARRALS